MKYIKKTYEQIKMKMIAVSAMLTVTLMSSPIYCDKIGDASEKVAKGFNTSAQGVGKWLVLIALSGLGITLIIGSQRMKEQGKEKVPDIMLGAGILIFGVDIVVAFWNLFT